MDLTLYGLYQQVTRFTQISDLSYTTAYILIGQKRFYLQHIMNCFTLFFFHSNKFLKEVQSNFFNYSEPQVCPWWPLLFLSLDCVRYASISGNGLFVDKYGFRLYYRYEPMIYLIPSHLSEYAYKLPVQAFLPRITVCLLGYSNSPFGL